MKRNILQAGLLLVMGLLCLLIAALSRPPLSTYPLGIMMLGLGLLVAALVNPARLLPAACMIAPLGIVVFLFFNHTIPGNQVLSSYILALGIGLLAVALLTRLHLIGTGALTPALLVILVGAVELYLPQAPRNFIPFALSFWLPGSSFLLLGVIYLALSRVSSHQKESIANSKGQPD